MSNLPNELKYQRVLLKLSGEALMGNEAYGIDPEVIDRLAAEISELNKRGAEVAVVIGGGNIFVVLDLQQEVLIAPLQIIWVC